MMHACRNAWGVAEDALMSEEGEGHVFPASLISMVCV